MYNRRRSGFNNSRKRGRYDNDRGGFHRRKRRKMDDGSGEFRDGEKHTVKVIKSEALQKKNIYNETVEEKMRREKDEDFMKRIQEKENAKQAKISKILQSKFFKAPSRWHENNEDDPQSIPPFPTFIPYGLSEKAMKAFLIRARIDEITRRLQVGIIFDASEIRSPSPEPTFDKYHRRRNTRVQRIKLKLLSERADLVDKALLINPMFKPPLDFRFQTKKIQKKIPIPVEKYPDYNFIGLIIGPRGATQKRLERETGTKIAIRGKGSIKVGKVVKPLPGQDEPLHILITAENEKSLHKAIEVIEKLLIPVEEGKNEFKREQLRQLAKIHGTLRDENEKDNEEDSATLSKRLRNYGKENVIDYEDIDNDKKDNNDKKKTLFGHDIGKYENMNLDDDEELEEQFEKFLDEVSGSGKNSFSQYYKIREKPLYPPGIEGLRKDNVLYNIQKKKEEKEDDNVTEEDKVFEDLFFTTLFPPGSEEEEQFMELQRQQEMMKQQEELFKLDEVDEEQKEDGIKEESKKKKLSSKSDVPPWLL